MDIVMVAIDTGQILRDFNVRREIITESKEQ